MKDRIPISKTRIPYRFEMTLGNEQFTFEIGYNATADLFTVSTFKAGKLICANEPLKYGLPLWGDCYMVGNFPCLTILPLDESGEANQVTWRNFGETVFLCIDDEPEAGENKSA